MTEVTTSAPQKKYFRQRAHANPLSDRAWPFPTRPELVDWSEHFPRSSPQQGPHFADVGCGYGGLLVDLAPLFPDKLMLGMEIRDKVQEYVAQRIKHLRAEHPGSYENISVLQTNAMKYMSNYFRPRSLEKLFFLFPDPHFKRSKHRLRIVHTTRLSEYAHLMVPGGLLYTITDVEDLAVWMAEHCAAHPLFERVPEEQLKDCPVVKCVYTATEEGKKVERNNGKKFLAVFRRLPSPADD
jgi:tRNA (guanine-N7-)-methyltransferase